MTSFAVAPVLFFGAATSVDAGCIDLAAARFDVPPALLAAIVRQESSGRCNSKHPRNRNGTYDIGCAGINSSWIPELTHRFGITEAALRSPCTNVHVGAWILARNMRQHGDTWRAVGAYNAIGETKRRDYAWKIVAQLQRHAAR